MAKIPGEKLLSEVIQERRATPSFEEVPIHSADLEKIVRAGLAAPSAYNLQPWRFILVRDREQKKKLRAASFNQPKVEEASVVVVACGDPEGWKHGDLDVVLDISKDHGFGSDEQREKIRGAVTGFLSSAPGNAGGLGPDYAVWVNRHVMIAFTTMMWTAETLGYDTAPMEGFEEDKVKALLRIPDRVRVVALLGIGRRKGPDKAYAGRFNPERVVFADEWGKKIDF
ncbi:MAG TPA: nitroreductase family protein [Candidatus Limnocylindrales bacterium]|nr:nitroreductase family protein [Candidatus Limnocylindrales bacterium]